MSKNSVIKPRPAKPFLSKDGTYVFPFIGLDPTPGGSNLGRIEWHCELVRSRKTRDRYYLAAIYVWATQTRDKRYAGKYFEIACHSSGLSGRKLTNMGNALIECVWTIGYCGDHGNVTLSAYPANHHKELVIRAGSSISIDVYFR